jgi:hypothetical protein
VERRQRGSTWTVWTSGALFTAMIIGVSGATAETTAQAPDASWREPLDRAEAAMSTGEIHRAEQAWEEAQRAAMRPTIPPSGLINVGLAYLKIGEAAHDRPTAVARTRHLLLRALFRARHNRDVDGLAAVSHAFARLGDCAVAERTFIVVRTMAPKYGSEPPSCQRPDASRQPSASPRSPTLDR